VPDSRNASSTVSRPTPSAAEPGAYSAPWCAVMSTATRSRCATTTPCTREVGERGGVDDQPPHAEVSRLGQAVVVAQAAGELHVGAGYRFSRTTACTTSVFEPSPAAASEVGHVDPLRALLHPRSCCGHRVAEGGAAVDVTMVEHAHLAPCDLDPGHERELRLRHEGSLRWAGPGPPAPHVTSAFAGPWTAATRDTGPRGIDEREGDA